eukprot:661898-Prymnesium_polylepis.1
MPSPSSMSMASSRHAPPARMDVAAGPSQAGARVAQSSLQAQMHARHAAEHVRKLEAAREQARDAHPLVRILLLLRLEALADEEAIAETVQRIRTTAAHTVVSSLLR